MTAPDDSKLEFIDRLQGGSRDPLAVTLSGARAYKVGAQAEVLKQYLRRMYEAPTLPTVYLDEPFVHLALAQVSLPPMDGATTNDARLLVFWINATIGDEARQIIPLAFMEASGARLATQLRELHGINVLLAVFRDLEGRPGVEIQTSALQGDSDVGEAEVLRLNWSPDERTELVTLPQLQLVRLLQLRQRRDALDVARAFVQSWRGSTLSLADAKSDGVYQAQRSFAFAQLTLTDTRVLRIAEDLGIENDAQLQLAEGYLLPSLTVALTLDGKAFQERAAYAPADRMGRRIATAPNLRPTFRFACGDPQVPPSYTFRDVNIHGFRVDADPTQLEMLCDHYLNTPFGKGTIKYRLASTSVVIEVLHYGEITSHNPLPGMRAEDAETQDEVIFRILVGKETDGGQFRDPRVFCPLIIVNSPWSMVAGREVIGFPKVFGHFLPPNPEAEGIDALATVRSDRGEILLGLDTGTIAAVKPEQSGWLWTDADLTGSARDVDSFMMPWLQRNGREYGMIQTKPPRPDDLACAPERVEGRYRVQNLRISLQHHEAQLRIHPGLARALGIGGELQIIPPDRWYHAGCDFQLDIEDPLRL